MLLFQVKVGSSLVFLDARVPDCFRRECNFANVVTDAFVFHYANKSGNDEHWTNASIAIQTSKSITTSIAEGKIISPCLPLTSIFPSMYSYR